MNKNVKKNRFLKEFLTISSKKGWNLDVYKETIKKLKYNPNDLDKLFPAKIDDLILYYNFIINEKLSNNFKKKKFDKKSVRLSILNAVKIRFELLNKDKDSIKKSLIFLSNPSKQILSSKLIYKTVDYIWRLIGDKSKDYNFYTKRAILVSIYSLAIFIWISDKSNSLNKTFNFLEKSIMNMNIVTNIKEKLKQTLNQIL